MISNYQKQSIQGKAMRIKLIETKKKCITLFLIIFFEDTIESNDSFLCSIILKRKKDNYIISFRDLFLQFDRQGIPSLR